MGAAGLVIDTILNVLKINWDNALSKAKQPQTAAEPIDIKDLYRLPTADITSEAAPVYSEPVSTSPDYSFYRQALDNITKNLPAIATAAAIGLAVVGTIAGLPLPPELSSALGFSDGGYTGNGYKLQPAGIVHAGEYVVPAWMVRKSPDIIRMLEKVRKKGYSEGGIVNDNSISTGNTFDYVEKTGKVIMDYFFTGDTEKNPDIVTMGSDIHIAVKTVEDILGFVQGYSGEITSATEEISAALARIENSNTHTVNQEQTLFQKLIDSLYALYPQVSAYYDKDTGKKQGLGKIFLGTAENLAKAFYPVINSLTFGLVDTGLKAINSAGQTIIEWGTNIVSDFLQKNEKSDKEEIRKIPVLGNLFTGAENVLGGFAEVISSLINPLGESILMLQNVQALLNPITTIASAVMNVIGPLINSALQPFVNILTALGQMLGTLLIPVISPLLVILQYIGNVFTWIYNSVLVPIGQGLYFLFATISNSFNVLYNCVSDIVRSLTFGVVNIGKRSVKNFSELAKEAGEIIQKISAEPAQNSYSDGYSSSVQRSGPENLYININITNSNFFRSKDEMCKIIIEAVQDGLDKSGIRVPKIVLV